MRDFRHSLTIVHSKLINNCSLSPQIKKEDHKILFPPLPGLNTRLKSAELQLIPSFLSVSCGQDQLSIHRIVKKILIKALNLLLLEVFLAKEIS